MTKLYRLALLISFSFAYALQAEAANEYYVYSEKFDNGAPSGIMGAANGSSLIIEPFWKENPYKGENCLKIEATGAEAWSGLFVQKGAAWRDAIDPLVPLADLTGKKYMVFSARSSKNYTIAKIGMGEGKEPSKGEAKLELTAKWQRYVYELPVGQDYTRVNGLLLVVFENAGVVFLDEVFYAGDDFTPQSTDIVYKERKEPLDPTSFYIFADKFENGIASGYMGEKNGISLKLDDNCRNNPYMGPKCMKFTVLNTEAWRGLYILYTGAWNTALPENPKLADLSGYDKLEFYARADVKDSDPYIIGQIGVGAGDKLEDQRSEEYVEVGSTWKKYTINLKGANLKTVNSLLFLVLPNLGTLYLDEVRFIKKKEK
jgi:hypothetical protein